MWQQKSAKLLYIRVRVRARAREGLNPNRSLERYIADSYEEDNFLSSFIILLAPFYSLWRRQNMKTPHLREKVPYFPKNVRCFLKNVRCFSRKVACIFREELVLWGVWRSLGWSRKRKSLHCGEHSCGKRKKRDAPLAREKHPTKYPWFDK